MKKNHICLAALLASVAFTSCVKESGYENIPAEGSGLPIEFTIPAQTKALLNTEDGKTVAFEDGDVVGLFAYYDHDGSGKKTVSPTGKNVPYKYVASTDRFVPVGEPATWGGSSSDEHHLFVYYPYDASAEGCCSTDNKFLHTLSTTQAYDAAATTSDIVDYGFAWSRIQPVKNYGEPVTFDALRQFYSVFRLNVKSSLTETVNISKIQINADANYIAGKFLIGLNSVKSNVPSYEKQGSSVYNIEVTVKNGMLAPGSEIDVRFMMRGDNDYTGTTFTVTVITDKGDEYVSTFMGGGKIDSGARASKSITLAADGGSEEEPAPTQYKVGDTVEGGVLYWISESGTTGKVLYPKSYQTKFADESPISVEGTPNEEDGTINVTAYKTADSNLEKFHAVRFCDELDGDWYLPAANELKLLFAVYNGCASHDDVPQSLPDQLSDEIKAARADFDNWLTNLGGDKLNVSGGQYNGDVLWTSTWKTDKTAAKTCRFGKRYYTNTDVTNNNCFARCIKVVDLSATTE